MPDFDAMTNHVIRLMGARRVGLLRELASEQVVFGLLVVSVAALIVPLYVPELFGERVPKVLVSIGAALTAGLTFVQWRLGKDEATFDKHYERLRISNDNLDKFWTTFHGTNAAEVLAHRRNMLVFSELDNLEYVIGKYRALYADRLTLRRSVRHFWSMCENEGHRATLLYWIGADEGSRHAQGYLPVTCAVARYLAGAEHHQP